MFGTVVRICDIEDHWTDVFEWLTNINSTKRNYFDSYLLPVEILKLTYLGDSSEIGSKKRESTRSFYKKKFLLSFYLFTFFQCNFVELQKLLSSSSIYIKTFGRWTE